MGAEELGRLIKQAREDANLSQAQLAERIGLSHPQSISKYERGLTEVPPRRMRRIAAATGKPLSFFLGLSAQDRGEEDTSDHPILARLKALEERVVDQLEKLTTAVEGNSQRLRVLENRVDATDRRIAR